MARPVVQNKKQKQTNAASNFQPSQTFLCSLCDWKTFQSCKHGYLCLVLLQIPKCFVLVQIFWASPKIWLHLVPLQKLLCWHKNQFYWMQIIFLSGTKCLWLPQYVNEFLVWHKQFGPARNILGPVKGQGIFEKSSYHASIVRA